MSSELLRAIINLLTDISKALKVWAEWYPYTCGKSYLGELRKQGASEAKLKQYIDDIKLTYPPGPGAPL